MAATIGPLEALECYGKVLLTQNKYVAAAFAKFSKSTPISETALSGVVDKSLLSLASAERRLR
jgi:hypothetical protein